MNENKTIFCEHYRSAHDNDTCRAGIRYDTMSGVEFNRRPCFWRPPSPQPTSCDKAEWPTEQQIKKRKEQADKQLVAALTAAVAITEKIGEYVKGKSPGIGGIMDCPVCGAVDSLSYSRAAYNGHLKATCRTPECVRFIS